MSHQDLAKDLAYAAPTVGVVTTGFLGFPWSQVSYMLAAVYTFLLLIKLSWSGWKALQAWQFKRKVLDPVGFDKS